MLCAAVTLAAYPMASDCQTTSKPATRPATRPSGLAGSIGDGWLGKTILASLETTTQSGNYEELGKTAQAAILARASLGKLDSLTTLTDLVHALRGARYLAIAAKGDDGKAAAWLGANPPVARRLFRALEDVKNPAGSLKTLAELIAYDEKKVKEYPDLAVAFATATPLAYPPQPNPCTMVESFAWYTDPKLAFAFDLKNMPYELSRYLANTRLSLDERRWAFNTYAGKPNPPKAYFDLKYDIDAYTLGKPKKIEALPYTLQNLKQVGGVCIDQAYFASEICKTLGMPSAIVIGICNDGIGHAWVAAFRTHISSGTTWDCQTGRYEEYKFTTGEITDPAPATPILDADLMLGGAAALLPLDRRAEADAAVVAAKIVADAIAQNTPADLAVLERLADAHDAKFAPAKSDRALLKGERNLDETLVEDLLGLAIDRNLAEKDAWDFIIELRKTDRLSVAHLDRFFDILITKTVKQYPDFSYEMVMKIVPTIPELAAREAVYKKALAVYPNRPDIRGKIMLALGRDYMQNDQKEKALGAFEQAAAHCMDNAEVVVAAAGLAEGIYRESKRMDLALAMYTQLYRKLPRAAQAGLTFRKDTSYYQVGLRLSQLLTDEKRPDDARKILAEINKV